MRGARPFRPECPALTDDLWEVVEACWKQDPLRRRAFSSFHEELGSEANMHNAADIDTVGAWLDVLAQKN
jgi:hypothetical protein